MNKPCQIFCNLKSISTIFTKYDMWFCKHRVLTISIFSWMTLLSIAFVHYFIFYVYIEV